LPSHASADAYGKRLSGAIKAQEEKTEMLKAMTDTRPFAFARVSLNLFETEKMGGGAGLGEAEPARRGGTVGKQLEPGL